MGYRFACIANVLKWTTEQPYDLKRFDIERSATGRDYSAIASVDASSTSYMFTDNEQLSGVSYYRLKLIHSDGSYAYSAVQLVNNTNSTTVRILSNPAKDVLQLLVSAAEKTTLLMQIFSSDGMLVLAQQLPLNEGTATESISINKLQSGSYFLKVSSGKGFQAIRFDKL